MDPTQALSAVSDAQSMLETNMDQLITDPNFRSRYVKGLLRIFRTTNSKAWKRAIQSAVGITITKKDSAGKEFQQS